MNGMASSARPIAIYEQGAPGGPIARMPDGSAAQYRRIGDIPRWTIHDWGPRPQHPNLWCLAALFCRRQNGITPPDPRSSPTNDV